MVRRNMCIGLSVGAFGAGMILGAVFSCVLIPLLLGLGCIGVGMLLCRCLV